MLLLLLAGTQFFDQLKNVTITPIATTFLTPPTPWPPASAGTLAISQSKPHRHITPICLGGLSARRTANPTVVLSSLGNPASKRVKPGDGPADMEAAQWLLQLQSPQQQAAQQQHQQRLAAQGTSACMT
eukprot:m.133593 g.133593  ORF g.133593 m.133593 type:complete len:129 (+) comp15953_c0_seq6:976-1362(+)